MYILYWPSIASTARAGTWQLQTLPIRLHKRKQGQPHLSTTDTLLLQASLAVTLQSLRSHPHFHNMLASLPPSSFTCPAPPPPMMDILHMRIGPSLLGNGRQELPVQRACVVGSISYCLQRNPSLLASPVRSRASSCPGDRWCWRGKVTTLCGIGS